LPGKVLLPIAGKPLLEHVIDRLNRSEAIDRIVVATTVKEQDRSIMSMAQKCNVDSFSGSEEDVLDRFYQAAKEYGAETVVRVTSDNPFVDPEVVDKVVNYYLLNRDCVDYASNTMEPTYPEGLDVEVFSFDALEKAWQEAKRPSEREHVTPYIWSHPELFRLANVRNEEDLSDMRWTLDTEADLEFTRQVYERLGKRPGFVMKDVVSLLRAEPTLAHINRGVGRRAGYLKSVEME
jgi:spore coat polysaccharide biosynthesis protein SpsF